MEIADYVLSSRFSRQILLLGYFIQQNKESKWIIKLKSKVVFEKSKAIRLLNVKITIIWDCMPCGLEEVHFSRNCFLHHQGRIWYFTNHIKLCSLQDSSLAHEMAEGEVNMQEFLLYIILSHSNIRMPSCVLVQGFFLFSNLTHNCQPHTLPDALPVLHCMRRDEEA